MDMHPDQLTAVALQLPLHLRARLAEALIASLDEEAEIEHAWLDETARRDAEMESGRVQGVPAEDVFRSARARLAERRQPR